MPKHVIKHVKIFKFSGRIERQFLAGALVRDGGKRVENFLLGCLHVSIFGSTFVVDLQERLTLLLNF